MDVEVEVNVAAEAEPTASDSGDKQLTGMAGEFLVVGQLFKRRLQASLTIGNAKGVDVLAFNPATNRVFTVEVKTVRAPNSWIIKSARIHKDRMYVFVNLNAPGEPEQFYIFPGAVIEADMRSFYGKSLDYSDRQAINRGPLKNFKDRWDFFGAA